MRILTLSLAAAFIKKFLNNFCTFATRGGGVNKKLKRLYTQDYARLRPRQYWPAGAHAGASDFEWVFPWCALHHGLCTTGLQGEPAEHRESIAHGDGRRHQEPHAHSVRGPLAR